MSVDGGDCESRDPNVTILGETESPCAIAGVIDWGDGTQSQVSFAADSSAPSSTSHTYSGTQTYDATLTATETCDGSSPGFPITGSYYISIMAGHYAVVSVGDSYSSGEGAGSYQPSHTTCDRSTIAWPRLLPHYSPKKISSVLLLACSGSTSAGLFGDDGFPDQISLLKQMDPSLVTVTIGGNDVDFAGVLRKCFAGNCVTDGTITRLTEVIHRELRTLTDDYVAIAKAAPRARLLVVGYPQLFPSYRDYQQVEGCLYLSRQGHPPIPYVAAVKRFAEFEGLAAADAELDDVIASAADLAELKLDERNSENRIAYVSTFGTFDDSSGKGHQLCTKDPWINDLNLFNAVGVGLRGLGHPNPAGQRAIARTVGGYITKYL